jgi:hypothetical protein
MSEQESVGMTYEQAKEAIESAGQQEAAETSQEGQSMRDSIEQPAVPDQAAEAIEPVSTDQGATEFESADSDDDSFMGSDFNPDLLPEELQPGFKQLQAAFTRKTQELAEQRKQFEEFGDPEQVQQAVELFESLKNPEYLQSFHQELGSVLQEMGLSPQEAAAVAQEITDEQAQAPELSPDLQQLVASDPELTPVAQKLAALEQELAGFKASAERERAELEQERQVMAQTAEIEQMARAVAEAHPEYKDEDWQAIFDRAQAFDGNVLQAAQLYESDKDRIIQSYLSTKPVPHSVTPTAGAGTASDTTEKEPMTLDEAEKAANAWLAANDAEEFTG